ncbi:MAG: DUF1614 domain-containing protein [Deltaproteobacteria bacterium]|jgi:uncharacterized membrane protein
MFFNPMIFFFILMFFFLMVQIDIIAVVFKAIGIPSHYVFAALLATLFGSFINIPLKRIPQEGMTSEKVVTFFGSRHVVPAWNRKETTLAVNLGGAVIPTLLSAYLLFKSGLWVKAFLATAVVAVISFKMAKPVKGVGIAMPAFIPPILAALISVLIAGREAPVVAYICGTLGTLIGADILNLKKIGGLGAPVASIGGAGTFDGIFLNGILAVLLSSFLA